MKLLNFSFERDFEAILLSSMGTEWDLHNWQDFQALVFDPASGSVEMRWTPYVPDARVEVPDAPRGRIRLVFRNVHFLEM